MKNQTINQYHRFQLNNDVVVYPVFYDNGKLRRISYEKYWIDRMCETLKKLDSVILPNKKFNKTKESFIKFSKYANKIMRPYK